MRSQCLGRQWTIELIKKLLNIAWDLWEHCNGIVHDTKVLRYYIIWKKLMRKSQLNSNVNQNQCHVWYIFCLPANSKTSYKHQSFISSSGLKLFAWQGVCRESIASANSRQPGTPMPVKWCMPGYRDAECNCRPHSKSEMEQCLFYVQCTITWFNQGVFFVPIHQATSYGLKLGKFKAFISVYPKLMFVLLTIISLNLKIIECC
jgi:hypothetical protein